MPKLSEAGASLGMGGHPLTELGASVAADETITVPRSSVLRPASNRFNIGITFTQDTFPAAATSTAVANAKSLLAAMNLDYVNMFNHGFGQNGPWRNADKAAGATYASRATWGGWTAWDKRMQLMRDVGGANPKFNITLLPPGWMKMDGGSNGDITQDPLAGSRDIATTGKTSWDWSDIDGNDLIRHTDAHLTDLVDLAKAISLRHPDVTYFSIMSEQKGNFTPADYPAEISSDGLSGINNYIACAREHNTLLPALVAAGCNARVIAPYLVLEGGGHDGLAATYAGIGFPQPAAAANIATNKYHQYFTTVEPLMGRTRTFLEEYLARVSNADLSNFLTLDYKVYDGDNEQANWDVLEPFHWYFFEKVRKTLQQVKTLVGYTSTLQLFGIETYFRKVQDNINVPSDAEQGAMAAEMLRIELEEGIYGQQRWAPEQGAAKLNRANFFSSTVNTLANGGGVAYPTYYSYKAFCDHFRSVNIYAATSSNDKRVTAVASPTKVLLINHEPGLLSVSINGGAVLTLAGFEVRVVTA